MMALMLNAVTGIKVNSAVGGETDCIVIVILK